MTEPLWSDERIQRSLEVDADERGDVLWITVADAHATMRQLRDSQANELAAMRQEVEQLTLANQQLSDGLSVVAAQRDVMRQEVEALRAQLARTWLPLPDGFFQSSITTGLYAVSIEDDFLRLHMRRMGEWHDMGIVVLPANIRLCRRQEADDAA